MKLSLTKKAELEFGKSFRDALKGKLRFTNCFTIIRFLKIVFSEFMAHGTLPFEPYSGDDKWPVYSRDGLEFGSIRRVFKSVHSDWLMSLGY